MSRFYFVAIEIIKQSIKTILGDLGIFIFSSIIISLVSSVYIFTFYYGSSHLQKQKKVIGSNPVYLILASDIQDTDLGLVSKTVKKQLPSAKVAAFKDLSRYDEIVKELGLTPKLIKELELDMPIMLEVKDFKKSPQEILKYFDSLKGDSAIVEDYVFNNKSFSVQQKNWKNLKNLIQFYNLASLVIISTFMLVIFCFIAILKKKEIEIFQFMGSPFLFYLAPQYIFIIASLGVGLFFGYLISGEISKKAGLFEMTYQVQFLYPFIICLGILFLISPVFLNYLLRKK